LGLVNIYVTATALLREGEHGGIAQLAGRALVDEVLHQIGEPVPQPWRESGE
jgi:hypothetical protein